MADSNKQEAQHSYLYSKLSQLELPPCHTLRYNGTQRLSPPALPPWHKCRHAIWGHMYNAFRGLATSSARPRQHDFSQVSNNEASVFHGQTLIRAKMSFSTRSLSILGSTSDRDRGAQHPGSTPLDVSCVGWKPTTRMLRTRLATRGGYVHWFATRRAVPPDVVWAARATLSAQARGVSYSCSSRNIAHAASFGRNERLKATSS